MREIKLLVPSSMAVARTTGLTIALMLFLGACYLDIVNTEEGFFVIENTAFSLLWAAFNTFLIINLSTTQEVE